MSLASGRLGAWHLGHLAHVRCRSSWACVFLCSPLLSETPDASELFKVTERSVQALTLKPLKC